MQILAAAADDHGHIVIHTAEHGALILTRVHIESAHDKPEYVMHGEDGYSRPAMVWVRMASGQEWRFAGEAQVLTELTKAIQYGKVRDAD